MHDVLSAASVPASARQEKQMNSCSSSTPMISPSYFSCLIRTGIATGRSRRTGAGARQRASGSVYAQQYRYVHSIPFSLELSDRPGAARECIYRLKYVRTTTPTLPSHSEDWYQRTNLLCLALHQRTPPSHHDVGYKPSLGRDGRIISAGMHIYSVRIGSEDQLDQHLNSVIHLLSSLESISVCACVCYTRRVNSVILYLANSFQIEEERSARFRKS
ncbi:hypothetical protein EDB89DRAFT_228081 [Lactarius sanguifluus]|nr:hypothetical protein EDB89DRAFT_228081 [Lactarius sanguifluus]